MVSPCASEGFSITLGFLKNLRYFKQAGLSELLIIFSRVFLNNAATVYHVTVTFF
jgi:hypothetical protein